MSAAENKAIILRFYEEMNKGNALQAATEMFAPDFVAHFPGRPQVVQGRDAFEELLKDYLVAFPDLQESTISLIAEGDLVAIHEVYTATHKGHFQGVLPIGSGHFQDIPPTGKTVRFSGIDIYRIVDGKIVEQWIEQDLLGLLTQLGAVTPT